MWKLLINYHAKSEASSLKIDWVMLNLVFGGHFVFWQQFWFFVNYHAKSGASSLKIDWVILNLVFGSHFIFGGHFFLAKKIWGSLWTTMQNLELITWKVTVLCSILFLVAILFCDKKNGEEPLWTTIQNLKVGENLGIC